MLRVGVVGLGVMGQHHLRVYSELNCKLVGAVDSESEKVGEATKKYGTKSYSNHKELASQIDAISICVPTSRHKETALHFLSEGVHCLVEKPIASTEVDAREMIREAERNNVKLMVGHIERFNPVVQRLKQIIDEGMLGKLMTISFRRVGPYVDRVRDVGVVIDSATHDIDAARYLVGEEVVSVWSRTGRFRNEAKEDHAIIVLDFGNTVACIETNWLTPHKERTLVATGSEAIAYLDYIKQELIVSSSQGMAEIEVEKAEPLKVELSHFLECIRSDSTPLVGGTDGLRGLEIALKAAGYTGKQPQETLSV